MKKTLFSLVALVCSMNMNAQVMKIMKGNEVVATYTADQADKVVFEEASETTGSAAIKGGGTVNWVQLWAGGPKFATKNVGADSATDKGTTMIFTDATKTGSEYVWGANWCTPSKADMDELLLAATSTGSTKVTCIYTQENSVWGFKFIGKEVDYTTNSVFFPAQADDGLHGYANYWSCTASGNLAWDMMLGYGIGVFWYSAWREGPKDYDILVRPVLNN